MENKTLDDRLFALTERARSIVRPSSDFDSFRRSCERADVEAYADAMKASEKAGAVETIRRSLMFATALKQFERDENETGKLLSLLVEFGVLPKDDSEHVNKSKRAKLCGIAEMASTLYPLAVEGFLGDGAFSVVYQASCVAKLCAVGDYPSDEVQRILCARRGGLTRQYLEQETQKLRAKYKKSKARQLPSESSEQQKENKPDGLIELLLLAPTAAQLTVLSRDPAEPLGEHPLLACLAERAAAVVKTRIHQLHALQSKLLSPCGFKISNVYALSQPPIQKVTEIDFLVVAERGGRGFALAPDNLWGSEQTLPDIARDCHPDADVCVDFFGNHPADGWATISLEEIGVVNG